MHYGRVAYRVAGERVLREPPAGPPAPHLAEAKPEVSPLRFGRMFGRAPALRKKAEREGLKAKLVELGLLMNAPTDPAAPAPADGESDLPSGYTYLGQFIAHEITFDNTGDVLADGAPFKALCTPQIDLDSLYGGDGGPLERPELYERDRATLKVGETKDHFSVRRKFPNDLRRGEDPQDPRKATVGDPRNDENLPLAQTHVAFIRFHNKVVEELRRRHPSDRLFECARRAVTRHFQWLIVNDYLPKLVDAGVLDSVVKDGPRWFRPKSARAVFMPLEFSAAAFRIGHSMVRRTYEWNDRHSTHVLNGGLTDGGPVGIGQLFEQTGRNGNLGGPSNVTLSSDWVIDWRRFYDFTPLGQPPPAPGLNRASRLDTNLNFRLNGVMPAGGASAADLHMEEMRKAISVRNLVRGYHLRLPTGEEVAEEMGEEPLGHGEVSKGPHEKLLSEPVFRGRTPLWYYILKEAEVQGGGNRLGRVGSRIVAETLVGLIRHSRYSFYDEPGWRPQFGRRGGTPFEMIDLLEFADVVDPIGRLDAGAAPR